MNLVKRGGVAVTAGSLAVLAAAGPAAAAPTGQDRAWLVAAHQSNLAEIAAGHAVGAQPGDQGDARVQDLARMLVTDHTRLDASLTAAARRLGVPLPSAPTARQQAALQQARAQSGRGFDAAWVAGQLSVHRAASSATQTELSSGSDATVLQLARTAAPVIANHLAQLRTLASSYGVPGGVVAGSGGQAASGSSGASSLLGVAAVALLAAAAGGYAVGRRQRR